MGFDGDVEIHPKHTGELRQRDLPHREMLKALGRKEATSRIIFGLLNFMHFFQCGLIKSADSYPDFIIKSRGGSGHSLERAVSPSGPEQQKTKGIQSTKMQIQVFRD